jgi:hypothetical protein
MRLHQGEPWGTLTDTGYEFVRVASPTVRLRKGFKERRKHFSVEGVVDAYRVGERRSHRRHRLPTRLAHPPPLW